jgi:hypothetical protein
MVHIHDFDEAGENLNNSTIMADTDFVIFPSGEPFAETEGVVFYLRELVADAYP